MPKSNSTHTFVSSEPFTRQQQYAVAIPCNLHDLSHSQILCVLGPVFQARVCHSAAGSCGQFSEVATLCLRLKLSRPEAENLSVEVLGPST